MCVTYGSHKPPEIQIGCRNQYLLSQVFPKTIVWQERQSDWISGHFISVILITFGRFIFPNEVIFWGITCQGLDFNMSLVEGGWKTQDSTQKRPSNDPLYCVHWSRALTPSLCSVALDTGFVWVMKTSRGNGRCMDTSRLEVRPAAYGFWEHILNQWCRCLDTQTMEGGTYSVPSQPCDFDHVLEPVWLAGRCSYWPPGLRRREPWLCD